MRCIHCGEQAQVIDLTEHPVFQERYMQVWDEGVKKPDRTNCMEYLIRVDAENNNRFFSEKRILVCEDCFSEVYLLAIEEVFKRLGFPRVLDGGKDEV